MVCMCSGIQQDKRKTVRTYLSKINSFSLKNVHSVVSGITSIIFYYNSLQTLYIDTYYLEYP